VFNPGLVTDCQGPAFCQSLWVTCEFCAGGSYPFEKPRKNKRREKRPAPVVGLIAAISQESSKSQGKAGEKRPDLKDLALSRPSAESRFGFATNRFPRR
jgi:hypothetical protein